MSSYSPWAWSISCLLLLRDKRKANPMKRIVPAAFLWCSGTILSIFIKQIRHLTDRGASLMHLQSWNWWTPCSCKIVYTGFQFRLLNWCGHAAAPGFRLMQEFLDYNQQDWSFYGVNVGITVSRGSRSFTISTLTSSMKSCRNATYCGVLVLLIDKHPVCSVTLVFIALLRLYVYIYMYLTMYMCVTV